MEKISLKNLGKNAGRAMKAAAALLVAAAFLVSSSLTPAQEPAKQVTPEIISPAPVVMVIEEAPDAIVNEEDGAEEKLSKKGFFFKLKMAIYGFFAACAAWVAHKVPWKKIFNKRNFYILTALVFLGLAVYAAWPLIEEHIL